MGDRRIVTKGVMLAIVMVTFALLTPAHASITLYTGADDGAGSLATAPNSTAAASAFDTAAGALGVEHTITFEPAPLGAFSSLVLAPGVVLTGADVNSNNQSIVLTTSNINITPACTNATCGYNTTSGGANFALLFGGTLRFTFSHGIDAFGAYITGVQLAGETITFNDGTSRSFDIPNPGFDGGTAFIGFTDAGASLTSLTINVNNDIVGVDDVRYDPVPTSVPEPGSLAVFGAALAGFALMRRRKYSRFA